MGGGCAVRAAEWLLCVSNVPVMLIVCGSVRVCVCPCGGVYLEGDTRVVQCTLYMYCTSTCVFIFPYDIPLRYSSLSPVSMFIFFYS